MDSVRWWSAVSPSNAAACGVAPPAVLPPAEQAQLSPLLWVPCPSSSVRRSNPLVLALPEFLVPPESCADCAVMCHLLFLSRGELRRRGRPIPDASAMRSGRRAIHIRSSDPLTTLCFNYAAGQGFSVRQISARLVQVAPFSSSFPRGVLSSGTSVPRRSRRFPGNRCSRDPGRRLGPCAGLRGRADRRAAAPVRVPRPRESRDAARGATGWAGWR